MPKKVTSSMSPRLSEYKDLAKRSAEERETRMRITRGLKPASNTGTKSAPKASKISSSSSPGLLQRAQTELNTRIRKLQMKEAKNLKKR